MPPSDARPTPAPSAAVNGMSEAANGADAMRFITMFRHLKSGQLVEDEHRRVALVNQAFCDLFAIPVPPESLVGTDCAAAAESVMTLFCDPEAFIQRSLHAVRTRTPIDREALPLKDGRILERDYLAIEHEGQFYGHVWTYRDVTAVRRAHEESVRMRSFYEQVLHALPAQVAVFDEATRFVYVNQGSIADPVVRAWAYGRTNEEYCRDRGLPVAIGVARSAAIRKVFTSGVAEYFEESFVRHGTRHVIERSLAPILDATGRVVQVIGFGRDLTAVRTAQDALAASEERLRLALHGADLGTWDLDLTTGVANVNSRYLALVGYGPEETNVTVESWTKFLHPDDATEVAARFTAMLNGTAEFYESEHRLRHKSGTWVWALGRGRVTERAADGTALRASGTHVDITERRESLQRLLAAQAEAAEATTVRERFLANISHELRTPLNAIVGLSHHLARTDTSGDQRRAVEGIRFSADNLLVVINDLLDLTRIRSGHMELEEIPFGLAPMLSGLVNSLQGTATTSGLALTLDVDETLPRTILGDPVRLNQVLSNLIGNALKFTNVGSVTVRAERSAPISGAPAVCITVADTGIGIAPQDHERIFEPFRQLSAHMARQAGGTGLGLSIVREMLHEMHGEITLESRVGIGTTIRVVLPLRESSGEAEATATIDTAGLLAGLEVLVVEDNDMNSYVARVVLEHAGAIVTIACNGRVALDRLREARYDVVLMDIQMPEMDGFEASWLIRNELGLTGEELPIIALTATALANEQRRAQACGMTDYILKPFQPETLCLRIAQILERAAPQSGAPTLPPLPAVLPVQTAPMAPLVPLAAPEPQLLIGTRILLVDDNEMNRQVAALFLEQSGATVTPAGTGAAAIEALRTATFDLVMMDIQMPGMSGFEATRQIRERLGLGSDVLPVVALTATALSEEERRTHAAEMSDYILKPFHPDLLCRRVAAVMARHRALT